MKLVIKLSSFLVILGSSLWIAVLSYGHTMASETMVTIKTEKMEQLETYRYWEINQGTTAEQLYPHSDDELIKRYGEPKEVIQKISTEAFQLILPIGKNFYIKQVMSEKNGRQMIPIVLETVATEVTVIAPYKEFKGVGDYRFVKMSSQGGGLAGAVFQVERVMWEGESDPVQTASGPYRITSGKDGRFIVKDLPFGFYLLKEIKAPAGYRLRTDPIIFEVTETSGQVRPALKIVSKPIVPYKTHMPCTSKCMRGVAFIVGVMSLTFGWWLTSQGELSEDKVGLS